MKFVKLEKKYSYQPWYTKKPILVSKEMRCGNFIYYKLNIEWAGFKVKVDSQSVIIDEECQQRLREEKLKRII